MIIEEVGTVSIIKQIEQNKKWNRKRKKTKRYDIEAAIFLLYFVNELRIFFESGRWDNIASNLPISSIS